MNITSTPRSKRSNSNPLSHYAPDSVSFELAMERYCRIHWSASHRSRRSSSEPTCSLVDSGRSSLTSYGSEESLSADELDVFSDSYSDFEEDYADDAGTAADVSLKSFDHLWEEWKIPVKDITIYRNHPFVQTRTRQIKTSAYWHGAVLVYQRSLETAKDRKDFVSDVHSLCKIRHENIQLFMGVCVDMPEDNVAIVMSELKGETLYSHLNKYGQKFARPNRLRILRQIAEGMEYLHAKQIPHGNLSTSIITYHHRVCISMSLSNGYSRNINSTDLAYLPVEDIRKIRADVSKKMTLTTQPSFSSDVFAYGTIAYELVTLERPFHDSPITYTIWRMGNMKYPSLDLLPKGRLRSLISKCWSCIPSDRPTFKKIMFSVQEEPTSILDKYTTGTIHLRNCSVPAAHTYSLEV